MTDMTLNQDKKRFTEWRSRRNGRQPIPENLWRIACNPISTLGITRVAREFRLNDTKLREGKTWSKTWKTWGKRGHPFSLFFSWHISWVRH
jgi:hypothetical protein